MPNEQKGWSQVQIGGKTCDLFEPAHPSPFLLIFLHGVGMETLRANDVWTGLLERHNLRTVCPHGKRAWWSNRLCGEFDEQITAERYVVRDLLEGVRDRWEVAPPRIAISGISMGGQGALRLAFKFPAKFPVVAAISSALDYQILYGQGSTLDDMYPDAETIRQDTAVLHVHPLNWPRHMWFAVDPSDAWLGGNQRLHEKLAALGIPHEYDLSTAAGGHSWAYFNFMAPRALDFITTRLEAEQLRV